MSDTTMQRAGVETNNSAEHPPPLWPNVRSDDLIVAPVFNGKFWFALVKQSNPDVLTSRQKDSLLKMGFKEGSQGRFIHPHRIGPDLAENLSRILGEPLDVLAPDNMVSLKPGTESAPVVPLEIQAGIRWFWKNQPQSMLTEIQASLESREDELSAQTLNATINNRLQNGLRIQRWVALALKGEVSAVTEPILGLGLQKAGQSYGALELWPEDLKAWHQTLADERGESPASNEPLTPASQLTSDLEPDYRPGVGESVSWINGGQSGKGTVIEHDPDDRTALWVSTSAPQAILNGVPFPKRERITVDAIPGAQAPTPQENSKPDATDPEPSENTGDLGTDHAPLAPQEPLKASELAPAYSAMVSKGVSLPDESRSLLGFLTRINSLRGNSPLMPEGAQRSIVQYWYGAARTIVDEHHHRGAENEAQLLVRDLILSDFNEAQPQTPEGKRGPLAVFPVSALGHQSLSHRDTFDEQTHQVAKEQQFCRIGVHPSVASDVEDAIYKWSEEIHDHVGSDSQALIRAVTDEAVAFTKKTLLAEGLGLGQTNSVSLQSLATRIINREFGRKEAPESALERMQFISDNPERMVEIANNKIFADYQSAGEWLNGNSDRMAEITKRNENILQAIAEVTDASAEELEKTPHPIFVVLDELHKNGLPKYSRAKALALMNVDLSNNTQWVGQIAGLNGARIALAHHKPIETERPGAEGPGGADALAAITTTGWIETKSHNLPFQLTIAADTEDLFALAEEVGGMHKINLNLHQRDALFSDEDALGQRVPNDKYRSLGRLIGVHADHTLNFGQPFEGEVVDEDSLDTLPINILTLPHLGKLNELGHIDDNAGLSGLAMQKISGPPVEAVGPIPPGTMLQNLQAARTALLTLTPSWRLKVESKSKMRDAIKFWVSDQGHFKNLARPERIVDEIEETLVSNPSTEMILMATKKNARSTSFDKTIITRKGILNENNDRERAIERAVLRMKAGDQSLRKGWRFAAFDTATVMRPQALQELNERRERLQREIRGEGPETPEDAKKIRGKRQDKGFVAGLSIKDLRGKSSTVMSNLRHASSHDQKKFVTKTKLWEAPDWAALRSPDEEARNMGERPMEPVVASFFEIARKQLPSEPPANIPAVNEAYAEFVLSIRDAMDTIRTGDELKEAAETADGVVQQAISEAIKASDRHQIPASLFLGAGGEWFTWSKTTTSTNWYRKALQESLSNTRWAVDTSAGKTNRRVAVKDEAGAMPMLESLVRKGGDDYRSGTDIDEQTMLSTFGFSGVEYGKSMTQGDRTEYLNQAYDGFMDLAKALELPAKAMSLGGTMGLAFGSRGRGGRNAALAHFEPSNNVINLTRMKGAGSMAHEYGHALANYFYRLSKGTPGDRSGGDIAETLTTQIRRNLAAPEISGGNLRNPVADAIGVVLQSIRYNLPPKREGEDAYVLSETGDAIEASGDLSSPLTKGAVYADQKRRKKYWGTPQEMFARSFETWIDHKLSANNPEFQNDFLVRKDKLDAWSTPLDEQEGPGNKKLAQLYPSGEQLKSVDQSFRNLFKTIKTKEVQVNHEHLGDVSLPILYSHDTGAIESLSEKEHEIVAECVMTEVARMCGNQVWIQWQNEMKDNLGNSVSGQFREMPGKTGHAESKIRGVIDLAYGASMGTAYHEAFHFAQSALTTESEQAMMDRSFAPGSELHERLCNSLKDSGKAYLIDQCENPREAQAYAYEQWVSGKLEMKVEEQPATVFGRVKNFLGKILNMSEQSGFKGPDQLFRAFYSGQLAERLKHNAEASVDQGQDRPDSHVEIDTDISQDATDLDDPEYDGMPACQ